MKNKLNLQDKTLQQAWRKVQKAYDEANFLQSLEWGRMNQLVGHQVLVEQFAKNGWCLMVIKNAKRGRYLEVPGGPLIDWNDDSLRREVFVRIREIAMDQKCVFVRLRPQLLKTEENLDLLAQAGAVLAPMHLHAEHTVMIDLSPKEEEILAKMRRQTRYEVRRAEKIGIKVEWSNAKEIFDEFAKVQAETAARQHFVPPDLKTLMAEREAFDENARIYVARTADGEAVAYGLILISGNEAEYFEAASTDLNRKMPGSYALLWQVIRDLKKMNVQRFNLWGIAPPGVQNHRYSGVTTFKTGFSDNIVEFVPAHDIVISKSRYLVDLAVEKMRKKYRKL